MIAQGLRIKSRPGPLPRKWAIVLQIGLLIAWILIWEFVPKIPGLSKVSTFFDPFFISSPTRTWGALTSLLSVGGQQFDSHQVRFGVGVRF